MSFTERQTRIMDCIRVQGRVRVDHLARDFQTTPQTIRKDLQRLAEAHQVVRFHGGASLLAGIENTDFETRRAVASVEKAAIGARIAGLIPMNAAIFINAGTTTEQAALSLGQHAGLRLITDNVNLANDIRRFNGVDVIIAGGQVRRSDGAIVGAEAVEFFRRFKVDYAIVGASAVDEDGVLLDFDLQEVAVVQAIIANARHVILAVDSSKFDRNAPVRFGDLSQVHTLVTDAGLPAWLASMCRANDVELEIAGQSGSSRRVAHSA